MKAITTSSNRTYWSDGFHVFEPICDEYGNETGHTICYQEHDGGELCSEVRGCYGEAA